MEPLPQNYPSKGVVCKALPGVMDTWKRLDPLPLVDAAARDKASLEGVMSSFCQSVPQATPPPFLLEERQRSSQKSLRSFFLLSSSCCYADPWPVRLLFF